MYGIYANIWGILMVMLPYIAYMDPMGYITIVSCNQSDILTSAFCGMEHVVPKKKRWDGTLF